MNPKAFVSHASEDKERFVVDFATKLRQKGIVAWLDQWEIAPGDSLVEKIFEGIGDAQAMLVVISKYSVTKPWVRAELNAGIVKRINNKIRLIPVVIDDVEVPESLSDTVWVRIKDLTNYDAQLEDVVMAILGVREKPPIGQLPAYVRTAIDVVPGLTKTDSIVLKVLGDKAMAEDHMQVIHTDDVIEELRALDVPEEEVADALEVLSKRRYVEPLETFGGAPYAANYNITTRGFDQYARTYVQGYEAIVRDVISRIVNAGDRDSHAIRKALSRPNLLVEHILTTLDQDHRRMIDTVQTMGRDSPIQIINVSAELKRLLRN